MSLNSVPSKEEVMGWNPQSLADYMRKLKLSGCDKVVIKGNISGAQFMQMTENSIHVFSTLYHPIIIKLQSEINKGEQKKGFGHKSQAHKSPKQVFAQDRELWDSDEFDNDNDYEEPDDEDSYICALSEPQDSDESSEGNNEPAAYADTVRPLPRPRGDKLQGPRSRVPADVLSPTERISKPPLPSRSRRNPSPHRPLKSPAAGPPDLHVDRSTKPLQPVPPQRDFPKPRGSTVKPRDSVIKKPPQPRIPRTRDASNSARKDIPPPPVPTQPADSTPGPKQDLDPSWYGGKVTRHQAEVALRDMNKDGAFVVRDSTKGSADHPYTLMVLTEGKVYNVKIRTQGGCCSLGNGVNNTKSFPGVKEMITHHTHTPLLLIDGTDQSSEGLKQSCLLHPAAL